MFWNSQFSRVLSKQIKWHCKILSFPLNLLCLIHSFSNPTLNSDTLLLQILIEHLIHVRYCSVHWEYSNRQNRWKSLIPFFFSQRQSWSTAVSSLPECCWSALSLMGEANCLKQKAFLFMRVNKGLQHSFPRSPSHYSWATSQRQDPASDWGQQDERHCSWLDTDYAFLQGLS